MECKLLPRAFWGAVRLAAIAAAVASCQSPTAAQPREPSEVSRRLGRLAEHALGANRPAIAGRDGWLFLTADVRFCSLGRFWGDAAAEVSRARKPQFADPLAAIVDFHEQLAARGVELWLAPVPPKAAIEADRLTTAADTSEIRCDGALEQFLEALSDAGVFVVDLEPPFRQARRESETPLFCQTDSHWTGRGIAVAATEIGSALRRREWYAGLKRGKYRREARFTSFVGDLSALEADSTDEFGRPQIPARERVELQVVQSAETGRPPAPASDSPVLLLGDSHTLVFHDPALHEAGAGLPDQLAYELGFPVDLIGVRGSGATAARLTLARQPGRLAAKKVVVWCFAAREFTENTDGWRKIALPQ